MADRHIARRPRIKASKRVYEFWCFYHQRFFEENKKMNHCVPKGCFEFNHDYYLERTGLQRSQECRSAA